MNDQDRQAIDGLFAKLAEAERQSGPRDADAEGFIAQRVGQQPAAPYLMAQTIVMQDYALQQAQARIEELERQAQEQAQQSAGARPAGGGGLFGGLFGSSEPARRSPVPSMPRSGAAGAGSQIPADAPPAWQSGAAQGQPMGGPGGQPQGGFGRPGFGGGGGFLAGAAQTAMGVAGGVLLGSAIGSMFGGGSEAKAAEAPAEPPAAAEEPTDAGAESGVDDGSVSDDGGFFGGGDWFGGGGDEF
ncbi:DUF2076 domain-containing protein [Ancylobacter sp.]|uniref:DUF2076 domain-containing protein n=1 Tax=Ancylobacter sp. TaxID=1872567 RepID=UPI003D1330CF